MVRQAHHKVIKMTKKTVLLITILVVFSVLAINILLGVWLTSRSKQAPRQTTTIQQEDKSEFSYKGKEGIDALSLLKEKTASEQDSSGLVISINNKKADPKKREYWAFYVNGKLAPVGPSDYKTKDADIIEWKIERY